MVEGFWIVQYEGLQGNGGGVVIFTKGKVFGGDSGATYLGSYEDDGNTVKARIRVHNYVPGAGSVIGVQGDDYDLDLAGTIDGDIIKGSGSPIGHQTAGLAFRLTKAANLP